MPICMQLSELMSYTHEEIQSHVTNSIFVAEETFCQHCGNEFCVQKAAPSRGVHGRYVCSWCRTGDRAVLEAQQQPDLPTTTSAGQL